VVAGVVWLRWSRATLLADEGGRLYRQADRSLPPADPVKNQHQFAHQLQWRGAENPRAVLDLLELDAGDVVLDVGCGSGFYSRRLAERIGPGGRVLAIDVAQTSLDELRRGRVGPCAACAPILPTLSRVDDTRLAAGVADAALMANLDFQGFELLPANERMLVSLLGALRPGGTLGVLQALWAAGGAGVERSYDNLLDAGFVGERAHYFLLDGGAETLPEHCRGFEGADVSALLLVSRPQDPAETSPAFHDLPSTWSYEQPTCY